MNFSVQVQVYSTSLTNSVTVAQLFIQLENNNKPQRRQNTKLCAFELRGKILRSTIKT